LKNYNKAQKIKIKENKGTWRVWNLVVLKTLVGIHI
jgi:hypothetical protein